MLTAGSSLLSTLIATKYNLPMSMYSMLHMFFLNASKWLWFLDLHVLWEWILSIAEAEAEAGALPESSSVLWFMSLMMVVIVLNKLRNINIGIIDNYYTCYLKARIQALTGRYQYETTDLNWMFRILHWQLGMSRGSHKVGTISLDTPFFIEPYPSVYLLHAKQLAIPKGERDDRLDKLPIPAYNKRYYFHDTILNVRGYLLYVPYDMTAMASTEVVSYTTQNTLAKSETKETQFIKPWVKLYMVIDQHPDKYLQDITKNINTQQTSRFLREVHVRYTPEKSPNITVKTRPTVDSYRYELGLSNSDRLRHFYEHELPEREKAYISTFFHPLRDQIWNTIKLSTFNYKKLHMEGHTAQNIFCLYGPPGTGKSSFAARIAAASGKDLITVDKSMFRSKTQLRTLMHVGLNSSNSTLELPPSNQLMGCQEWVIVLDEFDQVIDMIMNSETRRNIKKQRVDSIVNTLISNLGTDKDKDKDKDTTAIAISLRHAIEYDPDDSDEVTIDDLLDIIQGPSFDHRYTIVATTNNYRKIRDQCPRLFRDGRFKPIYFGYPDKTMLNQMSQHYYGRNITDDVEIPTKFRIPPCRILNHIKSLSYIEDKEEQYMEFCQKFRYDLNNYELSSCFTQYEECVDTESTGS